jgi:hypothetical protein
MRGICIFRKSPWAPEWPARMHQKGLLVSYQRAGASGSPRSKPVGGLISPRQATMPPPGLSFPTVATIQRAPSGTGRCSALASFHGARIQTSCLLGRRECDRHCLRTDTQLRRSAPTPGSQRCRRYFEGIICFMRRSCQGLSARKQRFS